MSRNHLDRLHKMLLEDTGSMEEADELLETVQKINDLPRPKPLHQSTASLLQALSKELPDPEPGLLEKLRDWYPLLLLRSQVRVVSREIWLASAMVFALGIAFTIYTDAEQTDQTTVLTFLAPVVAFVGIALLYDSNIERFFEIEDASAAGVPLLLLARATLLFGFDLMLGVAASVALASLQSQFSLVPLIMSWLIPMTFLSALAFFMSVFSRNALMGMVTAMIVWMGHVGVRTGATIPEFAAFLTLPELADPAARPYFLLISMILFGIALWLAGKTERRIGVTS